MLCIATVIEIVALIVCWQFDLISWHRDFLRIISVAFIWVWVASERRRYLQAKLFVSDKD